VGRRWLGQRDLEVELDRVAAEDDLLEDGADQRLSLRKAHGVESLGEDRREVLDALQQLAALAGVLVLLPERLELVLERLEPSRDRLRAIGKFLGVEEPALIRIEQPVAFVADARHALLGVVDLAREERRIQRRRLSHLGLCAHQEFGVKQVLADLLPDPRIERVRPHMVRTAGRAPGQARRSAAVVDRCPLRAVLVGHAVTLETAPAAAHQAPEQPVLLVQIARTELLIANVSRLRALEPLAIDERRDRDRDPLGGRPG